MSGMGIQATFPIKTFREITGPLLDIRSPKEFMQGHWPGAINIPLFNNEERIIIGKTYKTKGRESAILIGLNITTPKIKDLKKQLERESKESSEKCND